MVESPSHRGDPRPARTRRAILAAADELLATRGVEGTTIARVASQAGVSVGSIYAHFGSKDALILALGGKAVEPRIDQLAEIRETASPLARIIAAGDAYVRFAIDEPSTFRALVIRAHEPPADGIDTEPADSTARQLTERVGAMLDDLSSDLTQAMDAGEIRQAPVRDALVGLLATWNGVADLVARRDGLGISEELAWSALAASQTLLQQDLPTDRPLARAASQRAA